MLLHLVTMCSGDGVLVCRWRMMRRGGERGRGRGGKGGEGRRKGEEGEGEGGRFVPLW